MVEVEAMSACAKPRMFEVEAMNACAKSKQR
jgi:hypothetical protein